MTNKVNCDRLDEFLEGRLSQQETESFQQHLECCSDCRNEVRINEQLEQLICEAWKPIKAPVSISVSVAESNQSGESKWRRNRQLRWSIGIAATLLLALGVSFWFGDPNTGIETTQVGSGQGGLNRTEEDVVQSGSNPESRSGDEDAQSNSHDSSAVEDLEPVVKRLQTKEPPEFLIQEVAATPSFTVLNVLPVVSEFQNTTRTDAN